MKYRKKPVVVEAVRWTGDDAEFCAIIDLASDGECTISMTDGELYIDTLEGAMRADYGDWVIRGVKGEIYPCKHAIFKETYEAVDDAG